MYKKVVSGLFLALIAVPAFAASPAFEEVDADQNGVVSRNEAMAAGISDEAFAQADANQDKQLSADEYMTLSEPKG